jgi:2-phospho-L-lactate/phosphoenolpyruvate guanylyltransferase
MDSLMAIVPVKPFAEAKMRLAGTLGEKERIALAQRLLKRTLLKLTRAREISRVVVISRDEDVLKIARAYDAFSLLESSSSEAIPNLNDALEQARRVCMANGARGILVIPTDLPRLRIRDIEKIIGLSEPAPRVVIAPAARDGGTNALLLNPANAIAFQFGENSFAKHHAAAIEQEIGIELYNSDTVAFDLDVPEDLQKTVSRADS